MTPADPLAVASMVAEILDELGVRYVIGGSVAASLFGEPRSTLDLDMMVDLTELQARRLAARLAGSCYVDEETAVNAVKSRSSFNAIHYDTSMKIDFFLPEAAAFATRQLDRRRAIDLGSSRRLYFYAPGDLVIRKLLWYRLGGESSERQWRDVIGILKTSSSIIDFETMQSDARELQLSELLEKAIADAVDPTGS